MTNWICKSYKRRKSSFSSRRKRDFVLNLSLLKDKQTTFEKIESYQETKNLIEPKETKWFRSLIKLSLPRKTKNHRNVLEQGSLKIMWPKSYQLTFSNEKQKVNQLNEKSNDTKQVKEKDLREKEKEKEKEKDQFKEKEKEKEINRKKEIDDLVLLGVDHTTLPLDSKIMGKDREFLIINGNRRSNAFFRYTKKQNKSKLWRVFVGYTSEKVFEKWSSWHDENKPPIKIPISFD